MMHKIYAILINGSERFRVEAVGQFSAVILGGQHERYQKLVSFFLTAVEVKDEGGATCE